MSATLFQRKSGGKEGVWFARTHVAGRGKDGLRLCLKTTDRAEAERRLKESRFSDLVAAHSINPSAAALFSVGTNMVAKLATDSPDKLTDIIEVAETSRICTRAVRLLIKPQNRATPTNLRGLADRWLADSRYTGHSPKYILGHRWNISQWFRWRPALNSIHPSELTKADVYDFVNRQPGPGLATRRRSLGSIHAFCSWLNAEGLGRNCAHGVSIALDLLHHEQKETTVWKTFTPEEQALIFTALERNWMPFERHWCRTGMADQLIGDPAQAQFWFHACRLARATGMRLSDIAQLEWASLSLPGFIIVWVQKVKKRLCLPLRELDRACPGAIEWVAELPKNDSRYVFPSQKEIYSDVTRRVEFSWTFYRVLEKLRMQERGKSFHSWRHTAVTAWHQAGFAPENCAAFAGHATVEMNQNYNHQQTA